MAPPSACPTPRKTNAPIPNRAARSPAAAFRCCGCWGCSACPPACCWTTPRATSTSPNCALLRGLLDGFKPGDSGGGRPGLLQLRAAGAAACGAESAASFRLHQAGRRICAKASAWARRTGSLPGAKPRSEAPAGCLSAWWKKIPAQLTRSGDSLPTPSPGLPDRIGHAGDHAAGPGNLLRPRTSPSSTLRRWKIELWFRDIKTSMGMEVLRCKSPQMVHKELEMFLIAYNFIRCLMVQAGAINDVTLDRLSFKGIGRFGATIQLGHCPGSFEKEAEPTHPGIAGGHRPR